jgi:hypothetical protein
MMRRINRFLLLHADVKILLIKSWFLLAAIRLGLWILPFQKVRTLLVKNGRDSRFTKPPDQKPILSVVWAITRASRYVPSATCLTQALALIVLLNGFGHQAHLRIGVTKGMDGRLEAHAWVEMGGKILLGDQGDLSRFRVLSPQTEIL